MLTALALLRPLRRDCFFFSGATEVTLIVGESATVAVMALVVMGVITSMSDGGELELMMV